MPTSLNMRPLELLFFRICCLLIILGLRPVKTGSVTPTLLAMDTNFAAHQCLKCADITDETARGMPLMDTAPRLSKIEKIVKNLRKVYDVPEVPPATPSLRLGFLHRIQDLQLQTERNHPHTSSHMLNNPVIPLK
mmetsp:Transcript_47730/g.112637  ORF Transcript_47730/g.112637 Transcript_47730/m.112637 type:complete len:135 (+) Transcript_47730:109-513(+)